jgi:hypothetical protein
MIARAKEVGWKSIVAVRNIMLAEEQRIMFSKFNHSCGFKHCELFTRDIFVAGRTRIMTFSVVSYSY